MKKSFLTVPTLCSAIVLGLTLTGCATQETSQTIQATRVTAAGTPYQGVKHIVALGKFDNQSSYMRGLFSDGTDRLGSQGRTILVGHLQQSNRFSVMDRDNLSEAKFETDLAKKGQSIKGADFIVTGNVSEFGRKEVGDQQFFGILGRGKQQVAYAKVTLNIINPVSSEVVQSVQGAGEYALSNREIVGFGSTASYDATLNGKVLDLAIREAVNRLVESVEQGQWKAQ